jgi:predicted O-methyltransferase YrrM
MGTIATVVASCRKQGLGATMKRSAQVLTAFPSELTRLRRKSTFADADAAVSFLLDRVPTVLRTVQIRSEILGLGRLVGARRPRVVVEIGTNRGATLWLWAKLAAPDAILVSIDLPGGIHGGGYRAWRTGLYRSFAGPGQTLHLLREDSHNTQTLDKLKAILGAIPVDFLFIDGDHRYEGVRQDFQLYSPLVRPGGLVAFHDVAQHKAEYDCQVDRLWTEVKPNFKHYEFIDDPGQGWCGIGAIEMPERP